MISKLKIDITNGQSGDFQTVVYADKKIIFDQLVKYTNGRADITLPVAVTTEIKGIVYNTTRGAVISGITQADTDRALVYLLGGQSLSTGQTDPSKTPIITTSITNSFLFNGVASSSNREDGVGASDVTGIVAHQWDGTWQSPLEGTANKLVGDLSYKVLNIPFGVGGRTVGELETQGLPMAQAQLDALSVAKSGMSVNDTITVFSWVHGETLIDDAYSDVETALANYENDFKSKILEPIKLKVAEKTGQTFLPTFIDQTGVNGGDESAITLWQMTENNIDMFLVGPKYHLNALYASGSDNELVTDSTHLSPVGYIMQGEYHAIAVETYLKTGDFKCLQPRAIKCAANKVFVKCYVPAPPLVLDEDTLGVAINNGIIVKDADNNFVEFSVDVEYDTIILNCDRVITAGAVVQTGTTIDRIVEGVQLEGTNIRDSQSVVSAAGSEHMLHNWLVKFKYTLKDADVLSGELVNYFTGRNIVSFNGAEGSSPVAGARDGVITQTGSYRVELTPVHSFGNTGRLRLRIGGQSEFFGVGETDKTVSVTSISDGRCYLMQDTNDVFVGYALNCKISKVE